MQEFKPSGLRQKSEHLGNSVCQDYSWMFEPSGQKDGAAGSDAAVAAVQGIQTTGGGVSWRPAPTDREAD